MVCRLASPCGRGLITKSKCEVKSIKSFIKMSCQWQSDFCADGVVVVVIDKSDAASYSKHPERWANTWNFTLVVNSGNGGLCECKSKVKSFPSNKAHGAALISVCLAHSQISAYTARPYGYGASVSRSVPVYSPTFAGTQCAYPRRDGQAELTRVDGLPVCRRSSIQVLTGPGVE